MQMSGLVDDLLQRQRFWGNYLWDSLAWVPKGTLIDLLREGRPLSQFIEEQFDASRINRRLPEDSSRALKSASVACIRATDIMVNLLGLVSRLQPSYTAGVPDDFLSENHRLEYERLCSHALMLRRDVLQVIYGFIDRSILSLLVSGRHGISALVSELALRLDPSRPCATEAEESLWTVSDRLRGLRRLSPSHFQNYLERRLVIKVAQRLSGCVSRMAGLSNVMKTALAGQLHFESHSYMIRELNICPTIRRAYGLREDNSFQDWSFCRINANLSHLKYYLARQEGDCERLQQILYETLCMIPGRAQ